MSTTISGIPRVKANRTHRAKPLEATFKRIDTKKKKSKEDPSEPDNIDNAWRSR